MSTSLSISEMARIKRMCLQADFRGGKYKEDVLTGGMFVVTIACNRVDRDVDTIIVARVTDDMYGLL